MHEQYRLAHRNNCNHHCRYVEIHDAYGHSTDCFDITAFGIPVYSLPGSLPSEIRRRQGTDYYDRSLGPDVPSNHHRVTNAEISPDRLECYWKKSAFHK